MKIIVFCLLLQLLAIASAPGADEAPVFSTDKEAIDHYAKMFADQKPKTSQKFVDIIGLDPSDKNAAENMKPVMTTMETVFETSGSLRTADVMRVLKYGPSVRHAGYLLMYEHNLIVFDAWFFNTPKGWQLAKYELIVNADSSQTLVAIPAEFGTPVEGY